MRSKRTAFGRAAMLALVVLLLAVVAVPGAGAAPAAPVRPFGATFTFQNLQYTKIDTLHFLEKQGGSGVATHLGFTSLSLIIAVDKTPYPTTACVAVNGRGTLVAANGDELFFTKIGTVCPQGDLLPGNFVYSFVGGTGRFQGVTGSGTASGVNDPTTGVITENWKGAISY
jgi:hypothetical protein